MKMHCLAINLIIMLSFVTLLGDDTDSTTALNVILNKIRLDLGFGAYYMGSMDDSFHDNRIKVPDYLAKNNNHTYSTDNPEYHGASYIEFQTILDLSEDFAVYASLTAENRGYSFGAYNTDKIEVFPKYQVVYRFYPDSNSTIPLGAGVNVGMFQDYRRFEGLQLYNMDFLAVLAYAQYKKLRFSHFHIGDLYVGIGLNIGDYIDYMISLERLDLLTEYMADIRLGLIEYSGYNEDGDIDVVNFSVGVQKGENLRMYGETGYRFIEGGFDYRLNCATLLGVKCNILSGRLKLITRTEYRHYGGMYNYRLKNTGQPYRSKGVSSNGISYDRQIYPLSFLNRPFSQWAVFTEYHKRYVDGIALFATARYYVTGRHFLYAEMDFNGIKAEDEDFFLYPFFKLGFGFEPAKNVFAVAGISNKIMNLDKHYPTYYYLKDPLFTVELRRDINWPVI